MVIYEDHYRRQTEAVRSIEAIILAALLAAAPAGAGGPSRPEVPPVSNPQSDFDFLFGRWNVHNRRLRERLKGSTTWDEFEGTVVVRPVWDGRANLDEYEADGPAGHIQALTLRVFDPRSQQWSIHWATSANGTLDAAMIGSFQDGRGEFYDQEMFEGRSIYVRFIWSAITPASCRWEQAFSADGGKTWETNWIMELSRRTSAADGETLPPASPRQTPREHDGQHDFDFEFGTWKTHLSRLQRPLTGSSGWVGYEGTTTVRKVWNGGANLVELDVEGPAGRIEGLSLRLYNPRARQWSLNFANRVAGAMSPPTIGEFKNGRGEFYAQETLDGRAILVRFVISNITANSCHFEQAFSDDGGKTWEVNWIATDTRVSSGSSGGKNP
jgi:BNR/Asp-box repeat protein